MFITRTPNTRFHRTYTVETPDGDIRVSGEWHPPEPDLGILNWGFEIRDATNEQGVSVDDLLTNEDWVIHTQAHISKAFQPYGD